MSFTVLLWTLILFQIQSINIETQGEDNVTTHTSEPHPNRMKQLCYLQIYRRVVE